MNDLIDAGVRAKGQRVVIPGQFKFAPGGSEVGQRQMAASQPKLQLGILGINGRRRGKSLQGVFVIAGRIRRSDRADKLHSIRSS